MKMLDFLFENLIMRLSVKLFFEIGFWVWNLILAIPTILSSSLKSLSLIPIIHPISLFSENTKKRRERQKSHNQNQSSVNRAYNSLPPSDQPHTRVPHFLLSPFFSLPPSSTSKSLSCIKEKNPSKSPCPIVLNPRQRESNISSESQKIPCIQRGFPRPALIGFAPPRRQHKGASLLCPNIINSRQQAVHQSPVKPAGSPHLPSRESPGQSTARLPASSSFEQFSASVSGDASQHTKPPLISRSQVL